VHTTVPANDPLCFRPYCFRRKDDLAVNITVATHARVGIWLLVFVGTLFLLVVGMFIYSRARKVRSRFFWIGGVLGALVLAYLVALLVL